MGFFYYNSDLKNTKTSRADILFKNSLAITGGLIKYGEYFEKLKPADVLLMYEKGNGIIAIGFVMELWDHKKYPEPEFVYYRKDEFTEEHRAEKYEYHIKVDWFLKFTDAPIPFGKLPYTPEPTVVKIVKHQKKIHEIIGEKFLDKKYKLSKEQRDALKAIISENDDGDDEGSPIMRMHKSKERNQAAVKKRKANAPRPLTCEVCGFIFEKVYGIRGKDFIECHHDIPLYTKVGKSKILQKDLRLVCANCHRMIHRKEYCQVEELKKIIKPQN